jgi:MoxR-like ATPase
VAEELLASAAALRKRILEQMERVIVGQKPVVEQALIALVAEGHCLLIGVPGLAKTLLVSSLSQLLHLDFRRIQFTPDLMPSDMVGTDILQDDPATGQRRFEFFRGPIFTNMLLADEINRTPPKTQAALLQAMQEREATAAGHTYKLPQPFFVMATQNPIEQEGTYPLPEAQLDRFLFSLRVDYPSAEEEHRMVRLTTSSELPRLEPVVTREEIIGIQKAVRQVPVADHVIDLAVHLARSSRPSQDAPKMVRDFVAWGAGPRASQYLILAAKARALLHERRYASEEDVRAVAEPVLTHRILLNYRGEAEGSRPEAIVAHLLAS